MMKVFALIISHILAFGLGFQCNLKLMEYVHEKYDFDEAAKRLMEMSDDE